MQKTTNEQKKIGKFISRLRQQREMTQSDLAKELATSQSAVARMEKGEQNFSTEMLSKISQALNREIITLSGRGMSFKVDGGHKLSGKIAVRTAKNSTMGLLCASLLNKNKTVLKKVPRIEEVYRIIEVLESIGVGVKWVNNNAVEIVPPKKLSMKKLNVKSAVRTRSVLMMLGPLIHWEDKFEIPYPGGCKLGERVVEPHLYALEKLGVEIKTTKGFYWVQSPSSLKLQRTRVTEIVMYESSDTATENAIMAAARIPGKTVIKFATANYMVQDLCFFLEDLGVRIEGVGTTTLIVHGVKEINKPIEFCPSEDPIEAMLFLSIAATTNSSFVIERCPIDFLELELLKLEKMGFNYEIVRRYRAENGRTKLVDIRTALSKLRALPVKIHANPYPGLNIDNLPFFVPIATQAKGRTLIHDWVYENRAVYYLELAKLGADVVLADPHRVFVNGPTPLRQAEVVCPPAIRGAAIILIAMLAAKGTSILRNVYSINRGYEDLAERLRSIGARIEILRSV